MRISAEMYMKLFACVHIIAESAGSRMTTGRNRRATSLQPTGYGGGSGFNSSSVVNSNRLSRLSSQQDSYTSSSYGMSSPRTRRVSDIDNRYSSTTSKDGTALIHTVTLIAT